VSEGSVGKDSSVRTTGKVARATGRRLYRSIPPLELRAIAVRRRFLSLATVELLLSILLTIFLCVRHAVVTSPHRHAPISSVSDEAYGLLFMAGQVGVWVGLIGMFLAGRRLLETTDATRVGLKTLGLLIPGLNVFVALSILRDAKRTLLDRGVRFLWLGCDYSRPDADWTAFVLRASPSSLSRLPVDDDPNWIFRSATPEAIVPEQPSGWLSLRDLKSVSAGRRSIVLFLAVQIAGAMLCGVAVALDPYSQFIVLKDLTLFEGLSMIACLVLGAAAIGTLLSGIRVMEALRSSRFEYKTCGLIFPGSNVVVSILILREARQALEERSVRVGWLRSDFSRAVEEETTLASVVEP
jgi:hypothetical protein